MYHATRILKFITLKLVHCIFILAALSVVSQADEIEPTGTIVGQLVDSQGHATRTGNAAVFICDAQNGLPILPDSRQALELGLDAVVRFNEYWHAVTDDSGRFEFKDVPAGKYRLVAQAWSGISGVPLGIVRSHRDDPGIEPSSIIILHGVAESVVVNPDEKTLAYPKQLGNEILRITTDPEAPHNYLLISQNPRLGHGVLGPVAWGTDFIKGSIGITRMEDYHLTLIGLPEGAEIHTGLMNYDNNVGLGGETFVVGENSPAVLPIYASWSNGKFKPPPHLEKLTTHLEENNIDVKKVLEFDQRHFSKEYIMRVWREAHHIVDVNGYGEAKVIDLLAAENFRHLRKSHKKRKMRLKSKISN